MKTIITLLIMTLLPQQLSALHIRQIGVSSIYGDSINISLDTEAVEIYYFQSSTYSVSENTILLKVFYVEGFGSTIAYLNNNFAIPLQTNQSAIYALYVEIYYGENLQDTTQMTFITPLPATVYLTTQSSEIIKIVVFPNPTNGFLNLSKKADSVTIYDSQLRKVMEFKEVQFVDLSALAEGCYLVKLHTDNIFITKQIIRKR